MGSVWSTITRTRVSDSTAVTFSVKCFNPWKLYPVSGNIFRKWFASLLLIIIWSPTVNLIAVTTLLLTSGLHRCWQRIFKNTNCFYAVRIIISLAIFFWKTVLLLLLRQLPAVARHYYGLRLRMLRCFSCCVASWLLCIAIIPSLPCLSFELISLIIMTTKTVGAQVI